MNQGSRDVNRVHFKVFKGGAEGFRSLWLLASKDQWRVGILSHTVSKDDSKQCQTKKLRHVPMLRNVGNV